MHTPPPISVRVERYSNYEHLVSNMLTTVENKYSAQISRAFRDEFGLGIAECRIAVFLATHPAATGADISKGLQIDKALVSRSVARLRAKRFVTTRALSGNQIQITLTTAGQELQKKVVVAAIRYQDLLLHGFDDLERRLLVRLLQKLSDNLPRVAAASLNVRQTSQKTA